MKTFIKNLLLLPALIACLGLIPAGRVRAQTFTTLHNFTATSGASPYNNSDGSNPDAGLILSGNTLYGTASVGGSSGNGTVFAVKTDGTGFTTLHSFSALTSITYGTNGDGRYPRAGLILSGNTLYGTASSGGSSGFYGTAFRVNTNGTGFANLHNFTSPSGSGGLYGTNSDGALPYGGLILSGNTLYGTAFGGGSSGRGTVFKFDTDGTGFIPLHSFTGIYPIYGNYPAAGLILSGNTLYGTTEYQSGNGGPGTVFAVNTDGTGFTNLHYFAYYPSDGTSPKAGLILSGNTLYGTAYDGGSSDRGTVFKVNTDGTGFTNLYNFTGGSDGADPEAGLILSGSTLYGTAQSGGCLDQGTVFAIKTNGTAFTILYSFTATASSYPHTNSDGANPRAGLILSGNTLYGTANQGGSSGNGTMYSLSLPTNPVNYTITTSASPSNGGTTRGDGTFLAGSSPTATAAAASGYTFSNWTENGIVVSTASGYTFTVNTNRTLIANFTAIPVNYTITTSASPTNSGMTSGDGAFAGGSSRTVTATANSGYSFTNWSENGSVVSTSSSYTFTLNTNRTLVANFSQNTNVNVLTILCQSADVTSAPGGSASFSIVATGNGTLVYQWFHNSSLLGGQMAAWLVLSNVSANDAGSYYFTVSDSLSSKSSSPSTLTLLTTGGQAGMLDQTFPNTTNVEKGVYDSEGVGTIDALAIQPDGKIIVGGSFSRVNGSTRWNLARINADGSLDTGFGNSTLSFYSVDALILLPDGKILVATSLVSPSRYAVVRLNSDGSLDSTFNEARIQGFGIVHKIKVLADKRILIGGYFDDVNGIARGSCARLNEDGSLDGSFLAGVSGFKTAGGTFTTAEIMSIEPLPSGSYLVGGFFTQFDGVSWTNLARLNAEGTLDTTFRSKDSQISGVYDIATDSSGRITIAAGASQGTGAYSELVSRLNSDGSWDSSFRCRLFDAINGAAVRSIIVQSDGRVVLGGAFWVNIINVSPWMFNILRINSDGSLDQTFGYQGGGTGNNSYLYALAQQPDGAVLVAGDFAQINGASRASIARLYGDTIGNEALVINSQPISQTLNVGERVLLWVCAQGHQPLTYQWFKDGQAMSGTNGPVLMIDSAKLTDAGRYRVVVGDGKQTLTSDEAIVIVVPPITASPALRAARWSPSSGVGTPGNMILSWLDTNSLFTVESTTNLSNPHWTLYSSFVQHQGVNARLAVSSQEKQRYFRLRPNYTLPLMQAVWHLATNSARPFEIVQLTGGSITTNEPVSVRFSDQGGFLVELPAQAKGGISVVVPYYVNPTTFQLAIGNLSMEVVRSDGSVEKVDGTLALAAPATVQSAPGRLTVAFLRGVEQMLVDAGESSANKAANEATYLAVKQDCLAYRDEIKALRTALESWMTNSATQAPISLGNLRTVNGLLPLQLDAATLAMNDRLLLSFASATLHGQTASSPADEENWVENSQKNIDYGSNEGLDTMRRVTGHIKTAVAVGALAVAGITGAVPLGVVVGGTVVISIFTWIPVAATTALKVGSDTGDGSLDARLDPEKEFVWKHLFSTVVDTAVKWVQDGLDLTPVQSAGAKLADRVIGFTSWLVNIFSNLTLTRQTAPDGNQEYADWVAPSSNQVFYRPAQEPTLNVTLLSFTGKGLTTGHPTKTLSIYRPPGYPVEIWLQTTNSWIQRHFLGISAPDPAGGAQETFEVYPDLSVLVPGYPAEGYLFVHGPDQWVQIGLSLTDPTVSGTLTATWHRMVNGQLRQGTINGQLVGTMFSFSPFLNGPLLSDKTRCELDIDWDRSNVTVPSDILSDFEFARPNELLFDLIEHTCTGTITGAGRFTGTVDQNNFTATWNWPIPPAPPNSDGIDGTFNFSVDPQ
jgi:uncharacterized delta-60 repeat protein